MMKSCPHCGPRFQRGVFEVSWEGDFCFFTQIFAQNLNFMMAISSVGTFLNALRMSGDRAGSSGFRARQKLEKSAISDKCGKAFLD